MVVKKKKKNEPHPNLKAIYIKSMEPKNAFLFGKRIFCRCRLLTMLRCDNSRLFRKPSNLMANVLITKRWSFETENTKKQNKKEVAKWPGSLRLKWCSIRSTNDGATRSWIGQGMEPLQSQEEGLPCGKPDVRFWLSKCDSTLLCFLIHYLCGNLLQQTKETNTEVIGQTLYSFLVNILEILRGKNITNMGYLTGA